MNRLQKKCVIATASFHLLLLLILFVGPAFFWSREKPDTSPVLEMISPNTIDAASTGVQSPQPPPPAPPVVQPQPPTPPMPQVVTPPTPQPVPDKVEPVKPDMTPVIKPDVAKPTPPKISLTTVIHNVPKTPATPAKTQPDNSKQLNTALTAIRKGLSSPTQIAPVGNNSEAASNYGQVVKSIYEQAWILPDDMSSDTANTKVRVTISSDGTVISARIITPSGDAKLDASVQRTLERVQFIGPFPPGSTDTERTYIINFNPQIKRMLG
jgi:periplasmic protein TonB